jgi:hypothetical protein
MIIKKLNCDREWRPYYAWFPISFDGVWVCFEWVERMKISSGTRSRWIYRAPNGETTDAEV